MAKPKARGPSNRPWEKSKPPEPNGAENRRSDEPGAAAVHGKGTPGDGRPLDGPRERGVGIQRDSQARTQSSSEKAGSSQGLRTLAPLSAGENQDESSGLHPAV